MTTESGVLSETQYSFGTRFQEGIGTNPDELVAAALGGCFSMALSNELASAGHEPERIDTAVSATIEDSPGRLDSNAFPDGCARQGSGRHRSCFHGGRAGCQNRLPHRSFA